MFEQIVGVNSNSSAGAFQTLRPLHPPPPPPLHTQLALAVWATDQLYSTAPPPDKLSATGQQWAEAIWEMVTQGNGRNQAHDCLVGYPRKW